MIDKIDYLNELKSSSSSSTINFLKTNCLSYAWPYTDQSYLRSNSQPHDGFSILHIHLDSGASLFKQFHEAFLIFEALICLRLDLFTQVSLQFADKAYKCALSFFSHALLQINHLKDATSLTLESFRDF